MPTTGPGRRAARPTQAWPKRTSRGSHVPGEAFQRSWKKTWLAIGPRSRRLRMTQAGPCALAWAMRKSGWWRS